MGKNSGNLLHYGGLGQETRADRRLYYSIGKKPAETLLE